MVAKRRTKKKAAREGVGGRLAHINRDLRSLARAMGRLRPDPNNARIHDERNVETIRASLALHGQQTPIVLEADGKTVKKGSGTLVAARLLGWKWIAAIRYDGKPENVAAYAVTDNRSAELATWDEVVLAQIFRDLDAIEGGRDTLPGWTNADVDALLAGDGEGEAEHDDEPPASPAEPVSIVGEVYELGPHRLICGDSTDRDSVRPPAWPGRFDLIVTDPPYAIYGSASGLSSEITDDKIVRPFFFEVVHLAKRSVKKFGHVYIFCDWRSWPSWWEMAKRAQLSAKNLIVWDKGGSGLGNNYANTYELIGFFANLPKQKVMIGSPEGGQRPVLKSNVLRYSRPAGADRLHNAAKPVGLLAELIDNSTDKGELVLDPYCGSGSTIIAAERTGRVCWAVDIDPRQCDVTRQRYANFVRDAKYSPTGTLDEST